MQPSDLGFQQRLSAVVDLYKSKVQAAAVAGVTDEQLRKWLRGSAKAPFLSVQRLCDEQNVDVGWLASGEGSMRKRGGDQNLATVNKGDEALLARLIALFFAIPNSGAKTTAVKAFELIVSQDKASKKKTDRRA